MSETAALFEELIATVPPSKLNVCLHQLHPTRGTYKHAHTHMSSFLSLIGSRMCARCTGL